MPSICLCGHRYLSHYYETLQGGNSGHCQARVRVTKDGQGERCACMSYKRGGDQ